MPMMVVARIVGVVAMMVAVTSGATAITMDDNAKVWRSGRWGGSADIFRDYWFFCLGTAGAGRMFFSWVGELAWRKS